MSVYAVVYMYLYVYMILQDMEYMSCDRHSILSVRIYISWQEHIHIITCMCIYTHI
jgi:hypothetical protein